MSNRNKKTSKDEDSAPELSEHLQGSHHQTPFLPICSESDPVSLAPLIPSGISVGSRSPLMLRKAPFKRLVQYFSNMQRVTIGLQASHYFVSKRQWSSSLLTRLRVTICTLSTPSSHGKDRRLACRMSGIKTEETRLESEKWH